MQSQVGEGLTVPHPTQRSKWQSRASEGKESIVFNEEATDQLAIFQWVASHP